MYHRAGVVVRNFIVFVIYHESHSMARTPDIDSAADVGRVPHQITLNCTAGKRRSVVHM